MKRFLLDTNIFGLIAVDKKRLEIINNILESESLIIYSNDLVRKELRKAPTRIDGKNVMADLLGIFSTIVGKHNYTITDKMKKLARDYYSTYREVGGIKSKKKLMNDFLIVACASLHDLDIVASEDEKSMRNEIAMKSYKIVNKNLDKNIPDFIGYKEFKRWFA